MANVDPKHKDLWVSVHIEGDIEMKVGDLWPDGDAPAVIDAHVVADLMRRSGPKAKVLKDWCLLQAVEVEVNVTDFNPAYTQDETLIGEPPSRFKHSHVYDVWSG